MGNNYRLSKGVAPDYDYEVSKYIGKGKKLDRYKVSARPQWKEIILKRNLFLLSTKIKKYLRNLIKLTAAVPLSRVGAINSRVSLRPLGNDSADAELDINKLITNRFAGQHGDARAISLPKIRIGGERYVQLPSIKKDTLAPSKIGFGDAHKEDKSLKSTESNIVAPEVFKEKIFYNVDINHPLALRADRTARSSFKGVPAVRTQRQENLFLKSRCGTEIHSSPIWEKSGNLGVEIAGAGETPLNLEYLKMVYINKINNRE